MVPLCGLYSAMFETSPPDLSRAVKALGSLDGLGSRQARSVRTMVARRAIDEVDAVSEDVFEFLVDTLEHGSNPNEHTAFAKGLGTALWRRSPLRIVEAITSGGVLGRASADALSDIDPDQLVVGLKENPRIARQIVEARPCLLERIDFWRIPDIEEGLVRLVKDAAAGRVAAALLAAGRFGPASLIIERVDPGDLVLALESGEADELVLAAWLEALLRNANKAAAVLASGRVSRRSTLVALARASGPDGVPNDYGEDPWLIAVRSASEPISQSDEDYLAAFLMARALGPRSRSRAELICFAYTQLYRALDQNRLHDDVERLVTWRLDWGGWFQSDYCSRLKATVVRRFVTDHLDPEIFGRLTDDDALSMSLIDEMAETGRGRRYLVEVRNHLMHTNQRDNRARADYIFDKIK